MLTRLLVALSALTCLVRGWPDNDFNGLSQVAIVVPNLVEATKFYTDLGGLHVTKLSTDGIWGDSHYYRLFQGQILQAQSSGKSLAELGVVDISDSGAWKWRWNMIMFGNFMLQLMQFVERANPNNAWQTVHPDGNGGSKITLQNFNMWGQENIDLESLAGEVRTLAGPGSSYTKPFVWNSLNPVSTRQEQYDEPLSSLVDHRFEFMVSSGTQSERLGVSTSIGAKRKKEHYEPFCKNRAPNVFMVDNWKTGRPQLKSWFGIHHVGIVTDNFDNFNKFYTEVMGGKQTTIAALLGVGWGGYQDDILSAKEIGMTNNAYGVPNFGENTKKQIGFIAFENTYLEPKYYYYDINGRKELVDFRWESLSPAYNRIIIGTFTIQSDKNLNEVVKKIEQKSAAIGMSQVKANRAVPVSSADQTVPLSDYSKPLTEGNLQGYNYVLLRGPSLEPLFIVSYDGKARAALKEAMIAYDAKSGYFDETNPWKQDGFKSTYCCEQYGVCTTDEGVTSTPSLLLLMLSFVGYFISCVTL